MARDKDEREPVVLGFQGGGTLALKLTTEDFEALLSALDRGEWQTLADADGPVKVNLSQVVYVRSERDEHRVGFGVG